MKSVPKEVVGVLRLDYQQVVDLYMHEVSFGGFSRYEYKRGVDFSNFDPSIYALHVTRCIRQGLGDAVLPGASDVLLSSMCVFMEGHGLMVKHLMDSAIAMDQVVRNLLSTRNVHRLYKSNGEVCQKFLENVANQFLEQLSACGNLKSQICCSESAVAFFLNKTEFANLVHANEKSILKMII